MRYRSCSAALALIIGFAVAQPALGQEQDEAAIMAAYEKAMTPSEAHTYLADLAGTWDMTVTMWMEPGADPIVSQATAKRKMVLGGRYLAEVVEGEGMMGMPFEGHGWTGYDNIGEEYKATWIDNMGTGILVSHGKWDDEVNGIVWRASFIDPVTGGKVKVKSISQNEGPDKEIYRWYEKREGEEEGRLTMEIIATRQ